MKSEHEKFDIAGLAKKSGEIEIQVAIFLNGATPEQVALFRNEKRDAMDSFMNSILSGHFKR